MKPFVQESQKSADSEKGQGKSTNNHLKIGTNSDK